MSYTPVGRTALGYTGTISLETPFGKQNFSVKVPVETWMQDGVAMAKDEVVRQMEPMIDPLVKQVLDLALPAAGDYVTNTLWPSLQPKLRVEVDRAIGIAEKKVNEVKTEAQKTIAIVAGLLVLTMVGTSLLTARRVRKATAST
jgi:hypothetical protein